MANATMNPTVNSKENAKENEGEGNRSAARRYNEETEKFSHSGKVKPAADEAKRAIEGDEKEELKQAEKIGESHAKR
ncbi:hypothetical protein [Methylocapsa palsarum]|uniref:Uncharacterized protein n=1 Tax=Methylocapsa palsarum TaxID=1612308 RepID=A0A1I3WCL0_9HYPH|nr:hypothetical protein [Methylocapsa palsarum]SFK05268.1 hypothetical protein SAMN05444581_101520 [Methylocapsa palsarum]